MAATAVAHADGAGDRLGAGFGDADRFKASLHHIAKANHAAATRIRWLSDGSTSNAFSVLEVASHQISLTL
jgi:hypothetical protein